MKTQLLSMRLLWILLAAPALATAGCGGEEADTIDASANGNGNGDADTGGDIDADPGGDVDADTGGDTDASSDDGDAG